MSAHAIAERYAKSLLELANEKNVLEDVMNDVRLVRSGLEAADLKAAIQSPIIKPSKKQSIMGRIFGDHLQPLTQQFISKLINKGREGSIHAILNAFVQKYHQHHGIVHVELTTMPNISSAALEGIKQQLPEVIGNGARIEVDHKTDASLIGGFIVQYGDRRYDASMKHRIEKYKKTFA